MDINLHKKIPIAFLHLFFNIIYKNTSKFNKKNTKSIRNRLQVQGSMFPAKSGIKNAHFPK